jgi:hypothetical protein
MWICLVISLVGKGTIVVGIVILIIGVIATGASFVITNQCNSFGGQLGTFLDSRNEIVCGISGFILIAGIFIAIIGFVVIGVGATRNRNKYLQQSSALSGTSSDKGSSHSLQILDKSHCRYCGKIRLIAADYCTHCGRYSAASSTAMKLCKCVSLMAEDSIFCSDCGEMFPNKEKSQNPSP